MTATVKFSNGLTCPLLGLGTYKSVDVSNAVSEAIDIGYRHFDCAHFYRNEEEIGKIINRKIDEGVVNRKDLFITSKLWNTFHKRELVEPALRTTLTNLGLDYVDLYLMHWPMGFKEGGELYPLDSNGKVQYSETSFDETWRAMESCVKNGLAKSIGLSNFNKSQIEEILAIAEITPVNNQVECHPYLNQKELIHFCKENNITVTAYSPLGAPARAIESSRKRLLDEPVLETIGTKYNKTPAQVLIRYQLERGIIVIPKSSSKSRIRTNFDVFDFRLTEDDMNVLNSLNRKDGRMISFKEMIDHKDYPFHDPY